MQPLPLSQREKTYSAQSGFVYQYLFLGLENGAHVFQVSADRQAYFPLHIVLPPEALAQCAQKMGSPLRWNEEYALAKMSLFRAFDSAAHPDALRAPIHATLGELLDAMAELKMTGPETV